MCGWVTVASGGQWAREKQKGEKVAMAVGQKHGQGQDDRGRTAGWQPARAGAGEEEKAGGSMGSTKEALVLKKAKEGKGEQAESRAESRLAACFWSCSVNGG